MSKEIIRSFDINTAKKVGVDAAIIHFHIKFWVEHNKSQDVNCIDDRYWTYSTHKRLKSFFPYLSEAQIKRNLKKLKDAGMILVGEFNKDARDRTSWFTTDVSVHSEETKSSTLRGDDIVYSLQDKEKINNTEQSSDSESSSEEKEFSFDEYLASMRDGTNFNLKVIALYWHQKGWKFKNKAQCSTEVKRNLRAASALKGYSGLEISQAMLYCEQNFEETGWVLETVGKVIAKVVNQE